MSKRGQAWSSVQECGVAVEEARKGAAEGGVPIGAALVAKDGTVLGRGHNMRVQNGSATLHAEMSALENSGRLPASAYEGATMYTTLSPCDMCTGALSCTKLSGWLLEYLLNRGKEVVVLDNEECKQMMEIFIRGKPELWNEGIGV
ncbi:cytidine deaminase-like protein [Aspergillus aurantiobrunneus]